jgi:hypothetical protein
MGKSESSGPIESRTQATREEVEAAASEFDALVQDMFARLGLNLADGPRGAYFDINLVEESEGFTSNRRRLYVAASSRRGQRNLIRVAVNRVRYLGDLAQIIHISDFLLNPDLSSRYAHSAAYWDGQKWAEDWHGYPQLSAKDGKITLGSTGRGHKASQDAALKADTAFQGLGLEQRISYAELLRRIQETRSEIADLNLDWLVETTTDPKFN